VCATEKRQQRFTDVAVHSFRIRIRPETKNDCAGEGQQQFTGLGQGVYLSFGLHIPYTTCIVRRTSRPLILASLSRGVACSVIINEVLTTES
jgi:hypothetical protein